MKDLSIARKYAKALFEQALAKNALQASQQGLDEIGRVARLRPSLAQVLGQPFIPMAEKKKLINAALGDFVTPLLEDFLELLVQKKRFGLISSVTQEFQDLVDQQNHTQSVRVRSAFPMTEIQQGQLEKKLVAWLKSPVRLSLSVDPALVGGLVIQTRDGECDQSIRGKLHQLQQHLSN